MKQEELEAQIKELEERIKRLEEAIKSLTVTLATRVKGFYYEDTRHILKAIGKPIPAKDEPIIPVVEG